MKKNQLDIKGETFDKFDLSNICHVYDLAGNKVYFNILRTLNIQDIDKIPASKYTEYLVRNVDTWTLISHKMYGTYKLWWLICKVNGITNPIENEPEVGKTIKILNKSLVEVILNTINSQ
jgi:nucleoid-associated protein YgaU